MVMVENRKVVKSKTVLIDADAMIARLLERDSNYSKAQEIGNQLLALDYNFMYSPFTIAEVVTVLSNKFSQRFAANVLKKLRNDVEVVPFYFPPSKEDLVEKWFMQQNKKGTSYFDCYNMAILEYFGSKIAGIFSFDKVYKQNGFNLIQDLLDI